MNEWSLRECIDYAAARGAHVRPSIALASVRDKEARFVLQRPADDMGIVCKVYHGVARSYLGILPPQPVVFVSYWYDDCIVHACMYREGDFAQDKIKVERVAYATARALLREQGIALVIEFETDAFWRHFEAQLLELDTRKGYDA